MLSNLNDKYTASPLFAFLSYCSPSYLHNFTKLWSIFEDFPYSEIFLSSWTTIQGSRGLSKVSAKLESDWKHRTASKLVGIEHSKDAFS